MKKSELRQVIREEINNILNENYKGWDVLTGPGGFIFNVTSPEENGFILIRVSEKRKQATLDGEGTEGFKAIKNIASKLGTKVEQKYNNVLTTVIPMDKVSSFFDIEL